MNQVNKNLSPPQPLRLNPNEYKLLRMLTESITPEQIQLLTEIDRQGRSGWRNYSGRSPQPVALIMRRAMQLGLPLVIEELTDG